MTSIADLLASFAGMYIIQSFLHGLVAAVVVDRALQAWDIRTPLVRQRFRFMVVLLPLVLFPLYQLADPERGSLAFRLSALFDSGRWLGLELWGVIPLSWIFLLIVGITTLLFLVQELLPIIHHSFASGRSSGSAPRAGADELMPPALREKLTGTPPRIKYIESDDRILFSTTGTNAAIYISRGLAAELAPEEREVVIAHEVAHVLRNRRPLLVLVYLVRVLLFFNPVVLLEFRRIVQEEEKICDDIAAALTGAPGVLAATLTKLYLAETPQAPGQGVKTVSREALEHYSHTVHIQGRVSRLEAQKEQKVRKGRQEDGAWVPFAVTFGVIAALNYFIV